MSVEKEIANQNSVLSKAALYNVRMLIKVVEPYASVL